MKSPILFLSLVGAVAMTFGLSNSSVQAQCPADVNHDQQVNATDLASVLSAWGTNGSTTGTDINNDGLVNGSDLTFVFSGWGPCPGPTWATVLEWAPDAAVVTNVTLRNAITASGLPWRVRDNSSNIEMILIPPAIFDMGCTQGSQREGCYRFEQPSRTVTLTQAYYMGRTEVTQAQWLAEMGYSPSYYRDKPNNPVEQVSWTEIQGFLVQNSLRLPTEAEWEYACRAGMPIPNYGGGTDETTLGAMAWCYYNTCLGISGCGTRPVATRLPNAFGLHDTLGNVWEWVNDWWAYYPSSASATNPQGPETGGGHVIRGGSWNYGDSGILRSSDRRDAGPGEAERSIGFRVARNL